MSSTDRLFYSDSHVTNYNSDCRNMAELADESVQMVCTSPPYWGLRKYTGEQELVWGGDEECEHQFDMPTTAIQGNNSMVRGQGEVDSGNFAIPKFKDTDMCQRKEVVGNFCSLCGAWKGSYGLEPTPEMYIEHTVEILREIRRVLRKDGVVFLNLGDSYAGSGGPGSQYDTKHPGYGKEFEKFTNPNKKGFKNLKPKDLCLIPFRVAIAAQEDGWWVRSVIIWSKPNPMPESVTDRPTESHEYILMLTKSKKYYWDADAVREEYSPTIRWGGDKYNGAIKKGLHGEDAGLDRERSCFPNTGRNIRSVWEFPTQPYPAAHFAVFPEKLPEICIKAATPEIGCCSKCGAPWVRVLSKGFTAHDGESKTTYTNEEGHNAYQLAKLRQAARARSGEYQNIKQTLDWQPTCKCNADKVPSVVLDPFAGSGTTGAVAKRLGRRAILYELSREYCKLAKKRIEAVTAPFPNFVA